MLFVGRVWLLRMLYTLLSEFFRGEYIAHSLKLFRFASLMLAKLVGVDCGLEGRDAS